MAGIDQFLQAFGSAIRILHGKGQHAIVAPISGAGKLRNGHNFNGIDT